MNEVEDGARSANHNLIADNMSSWDQVGDRNGDSELFAAIRFPRRDGDSLVNEGVHVLSQVLVFELPT